MFTGIVSDVCEVLEITPRGEAPAGPCKRL